MICLFNENIISKTENVYLQHHLKLYAQNNIADVDNSISEQYLANLLLKNLKIFIAYATVQENTLGLLEIFLKYLHFNQHAFMAELIKTQINMEDILPESLKNLRVFELLVQFALSVVSKDDKILRILTSFEEYNQNQLQNSYYKLWFQKMVV